MTRRILLSVAGIMLLALVLLLNRPTPELESDAMTGARRALDFVSLARSYPEATFPAAGIMPAFEEMKVAIAGKRSDDDLAWEAIGPTNIGGRTLALGLHADRPNRIFAGSASGGLWRSDTGGCTGNPAWSYVPTGFPVLGVAAIAIDPNDADVIYIGTGESYGSAVNMPGIDFIRTTRGSYGIGILKSEDDGATWTKSLDWTLDQRRTVQKIRINPLRSASIWAATSVGTYRSYDAGVTWQQVLDVVMATDIVIHPVDTSIVVVANGGMGSSGHGIYRTVNGGASFDKIEFVPGGPTSYQGKAMLAFSPSNPDVVMASVGNSNGIRSDYPGAVESKTWLMRSEDAGATWSRMNLVNYSALQGWYSHAIAIHPEDEDIVWMAGQSFFPFYSESGGLFIEQINDLGWGNPVEPAETYPTFPFLQHLWADYHEIQYHPTDPNTLYFANDGGIFRTSNGGEDFQACIDGYQTTQFYNGFSNSLTDSVFALGGLQDNSSVVYEGSNRWRRANSGDGSWTGMNMVNNNEVYLSSQNGSIRRSPDRFTSDAHVSIRPPDFPRTRTNFITPFLVSPSNPQVLYFGGDVVLRSTSRGSLWEDTNEGTPLDGNNIISMAMSSSDEDVVYVATSALVDRPHVFRTFNGGSEWTDITASLPDRLPTDLHVDPTNDRIVYMTFGGFGSSHLYRSSDGGDSWEDLGSGLPDIPTWSVTTDPEDPSHIFVGNDVGVYQSLDGGLTWSPAAIGLPDAIMAFELAISPANRKLRVATHGSGVYERPLPPPSAITSTKKEQPMRATIGAAYPNPFTTAFQIPVVMERPHPATARMYDITGREVATIFSGALSPGAHTLQYEAAGLAAGTYIVVLDVEGETHSVNVVKLPD